MVRLGKPSVARRQAALADYVDEMRSRSSEILASVPEPLGFHALPTWTDRRGGVEVVVWVLRSSDRVDLIAAAEPRKKGLYRVVRVGFVIAPDGMTSDPDAAVPAPRSWSSAVDCLADSLMPS